MNFTRNRNWKIIQNRNLRVQNQRFRIWAKTGDGTGEGGAGRLAGRIPAAAATGDKRIRPTSAWRARIAGATRGGL